MKLTKLLTASAVLVILGFHSGTAQENTRQKSRIYQTWINLRNQPGGFRGVLYEIKDSSVLVSSSIVKADYLSGRYSVSEFDYSNIDNVSVRRKNSILKGTLIGTAAGLAGAIAIATGIGRDKEEVLGTLVIFGTPIILMGTSVGALTGLVRIRIPINGSFENFKANERRLEKFSYRHEYYSGPNIYEKSYDHKWYLGYLMNLSVPFGKLEDMSAGNLNEHLASTGGAGSFGLGYSISENIGASATFLDCQFNIRNSTSDKWWNLVSINAGPMFSFPIKKNFFLDLKPMIGYNTASLSAGSTEEKSGRGPGIYPGAMLRYNFSRRWCALAEAGYLYSNLKFEDGNKAVQVFNLGIGIGYRFR